MGGDLLNMYVGGTEQNISRAFRKAESERAILFLDEIDGLVQSRERAARSWEVTQVNELLHQMENFNGVMIGATNFPANLDPAVLRRFTFKLEFDYLDEAGKKLFFERMFHSKLSKKECRELAAIPMLAPGDFRTVRQSFFYLGVPVGNRDYIEALARESEAKTANRFTPKSPIGF
jgi:SpoVK/Ycf46/Vps4 family AAA+-type ATPase